MIISFRHKGLEKFFLASNKAGIVASHAKRLKLILTRLHAAKEARDMNLPGLRMHSLGGDLTGFWSVNVSGNWRLIFKIENGEVIDVDYLDYH